MVSSMQSTRCAVASGRRSWSGLTDPHSAAEFPQQIHEVIEIRRRPPAKAFSDLALIAGARDGDALFREVGRDKCARPTVLRIGDAFNEAELLELSHLATHCRLVGL